MMKRLTRRLLKAIGLLVLIGTLIATVCWAWFLQFLQGWAASIDPRAPWMIAAGIVILVLIGVIIRKVSR